MPSRSGDLIDGRLALALLVALSLARLVVNGWVDPLPPSGDEAQYWLYGEHLAGGYYSKPPLLPWLMRLSTELFGDHVWAMRLPSVVLHALIAVVLFALGRTLFDRATGTLAAVLYLTLPAVSVSSMIASTDPPMMLGWAVASLALLLSLRSGSALGWALTGVALGFGLLAKYTMVAWLAGVALLLAFDPARRAGLSGRGLALALVACLIVVSPNLVWNAANGFPTITHVAENADLAGSAPRLAERWAELGDFLATQAGVFGPIPFAILLWLLVRPATWRDPAMRFVLVLGLPLLVAIAGQAWANRANANWAAPVYLGFTVAVAAWLVAGARRRLARFTVGLHVAVFVLIVAAATAHQREPSRWSAALDPFRKLRGVDQVVDTVGPILAEHPEARLVMTDRMLMANVLAGTGWPLARAVLWNADGVVENHYELVTEFPDDGTGPYLVIVRGGRPANVLDRFEAARELRRVQIATHADRGFPLRAYLATDFRGYARD